MTREDARPARNEPQNVSPGRLPVKGGFTSQRPAAVDISGNTTGDSSSGAAPRTRGFLGRSNSVKQVGQDSRKPGTSLRPSQRRAGLYRASLDAPARRGQPALRLPRPPRPRLRLPEPSRPPLSSRTRPAAVGARPPVLVRLFGHHDTNPFRGLQPRRGLPGSKPKQTGLGHSRAKSSATALTSATTLRPPDKVRMPSSGGGGIAARVQTTPPGGSGHLLEMNRPPFAANNVGGAEALHRRQPSAPTVSGSAKPRRSSRYRARQRCPTQHQRRPSKHRPHPSAPARLQLAAPAGVSASGLLFNTNQQHYSPAKSLAPKPLTSAILAPIALQASGQRRRLGGDLPPPDRAAPALLDTPACGHCGRRMAGKRPHEAGCEILAPWRTKMRLSPA